MPLQMNCLALSKKKKNKSNGCSSTEPTKNDDEISSLLDSRKLADLLSQQATVHRLNFFFDDSDIFRAITLGDRDFFYLSRMQKQKIADFRYMSGNCFHLAVKYYQKEICHILVTLYGFDPKETCKEGCSALHWIMSSNYSRLANNENERARFRSTLDYLIMKRCDMNAKDKEGLTPLHYAAKFNNDYGAERLLKEWTIRIDELDATRQSAIHVACKYASERVFRLLIESERMRLDFLTNSAYDYLPLHLACRALDENCDMVDALLHKTIELRLHKVLRTHLTASMRNKLVKKFIPVIMSRLDGSVGAHGGADVAAAASAQTMMTTDSSANTSARTPRLAGQATSASTSRLFSNNSEYTHSVSNSIDQLAANTVAAASTSGLGAAFRDAPFLHSSHDDELFNRRELILNKYEFVRIVDDTTYFLKEVVNRKDINGNRALHVAIEHKYARLVQLLFRYGAMSILHAANRCLPVHIAAKVGCVRIFELLEQHNSVSFKANGNMDNLLHIAAAENNVAFLRAACDYYQRQHETTLRANKELSHAFESINCHYLTPLFLAASKDHMECVRLLVEFEPTSRLYLDDYSRSLFHVCCMYNSLNTLKYLLEEMRRDETFAAAAPSVAAAAAAAARRIYGKQSKQVDFSPAYDDEIEQEQEADHEQMYQQQQQQQQHPYLQQHQNQHQQHQNQHQQHNAVLSSSGQFASMVYALDAAGNTVLHLAAQRRAHRVLKLLFFMVLDGRLDLHALFGHKNLNGETFFQNACDHGCLEIVELVLKNRRHLRPDYDPLYAVDNNLNTPLLSAIERKQYKSVCLLIEHGANLLVQNQKRQTPLHLACAHGSYETSELLLRAGCALTSTDVHDMNPLVYACRNGNVELVKLLLETSESRHLLNKHCLNEAIEHNHPNVVDVLLRHAHWRLLISSSGPSGTEPHRQLQRLIESMPDKMEMLLDKCYDAATQRYSFQLIDYKIVDTIEHHPLYLITESKDERLITHHVTVALLALKSRTYPRIAFLLDLCLYIMFVFLCTLYHLISLRTLPTVVKLVTGNVSSAAAAAEPNHVGFSFNFTGSDTDAASDPVTAAAVTYTGQLVTVFYIKLIDAYVSEWLVHCIYTTLIGVVVVHLSKEVFQLYNYSFVDYFSSVDNWFQLSALLITLFSLVPQLEYKLRIAIGSFSILYAWICMSLFFQDLELFSLGRYIVAFRKTIQNSFKFMPFFVMICLGFFFSFKVGERFNPDAAVGADGSVGEHGLADANSTNNQTTTATVSTSSNFIRIITMMVGELDISGLNADLENFSDYFKLENMYNTIIFLVFVFMMCIIVLSLFEGIAVGEVKAVLDKAHIDIISANILYVLTIQKLLYYFYRRLVKDREPTFMDYADYVLVKPLRTTAHRKQQVDPIMRIENSLASVTLGFGALSRQLDDQMQQVRAIKKLLES